MLSIEINRICYLQLIKQNTFISIVLRNETEQSPSHNIF